MTKIVGLLLPILVLVVHPLEAQYDAQSPLQKSFEQEEFFFHPVYVNPYGIAGYSSAILGVVNDPLLNLQMNPATLYSDSVQSSLAYIDYRSTRMLEDRTQYTVYPMMSGLRLAHSDVIYPYPYPYSYGNERQAVEPSIAAAYIGRPFQALAPELFLGVTYQMIYVNEPYYSIPGNIYKPVVGVEYRGMSITDEASFPVTMDQGGDDNMHETGHFVSLLAGYDVSEHIQVGLSVARAIFDRDGNIGSKYSSLSPYTPQSSSFSTDVETRGQTYRHWDLSAGVNVRGENESRVGLMAGYLIGRGVQDLSHRDSMYSATTPPWVGNWNYYSRFAPTAQRWKDDGTTLYGGVNMRLPVALSQFLNFYYHYSHESVDLRSSSSILDIYNSAYSSQGDTTVSTGENHSYLSDVRTGTGTQTGTSHRFVASYQWTPKRDMSVNIGFSYESQSGETKTTEPVTSFRSTSSASSYYAGSSSYSSSTAESKTLEWTLTTSVTTVQIPVFVNVKTSQMTSLILGVNRKITDWEIHDATLSIFNYRNENINGAVNNKSNFIEISAMPVEKMSDIQTSLVLGLVVTPADFLSMRILATPTVREESHSENSTFLQWWVGLQLHP